MAEAGDVVNLMQAQLKRATNAVNEMARSFGVAYALWPAVADVIDEGKIDRVEIADFLERCVVAETWSKLGLRRYRVEAEAKDCPIESAVVCLHRDRLTIEVIALKASVA